MIIGSGEGEPIRLSPVEDDLGRMCPLGWIWNGVLHLFPGVTLEEAQGGMWEWIGEVVEEDE
jgi:hypothetical protein